ncbi:M60 family metallopeptidase [Enterococcus ureasiticus]|nr:M60 family metallopeptidase [Enterococcus ureasiticus]
MLKVRQSNPEFRGNLTVRLLGDDSGVEKSVSVDSQWKTISSSEALVPFVDTPYGTQTATLEYSVDDSAKKLPVYSINEDQGKYFNLWNEQDAEYALIKGKDFQLLLPKRDKNLAENLKDFASLNELILHYEDIFSYYNQMAGFNNASSSNKNGSNRYFLKADKHGIGGAYYGGNWTASTADTTEMWLMKISWGALHEIAHGYQTGLDGRGMYTGEVSNNIFAAQYQYEKYGKDADKFGWLFNHGKKEQVENTLYNKMIKNNGTYDSVDLREKLILLMMLKQKAGNDSFTKMYQAYREQANKDDFDKEDYTLPDLLNVHSSENSQFDFTPVLERWGLSLTNSQPEINRVKGYPAVASLADVVPESELVRAKKLLDPNILINSNFEIIANNEIAPLGLKGNLTVTLKTQNISELLGMKIQLKNGKNIVKEEVINGEKISFSKVPNGVYTIGFTGKEIINLSTEQHYLYELIS